jgi:hypothetical protein
MSRPNSQLKPYEISWEVKSAEDRADVFRVSAMLERIDYLEQLRAKLEKDLEFGDAGSASELSTLDMSQLLIIVERQIVHLVASVERLIGPAPRA